MSANNTNVVVVSGRLTNHPKLYETSGENVFTLLRIAINRQVGEEQRAIFYDVKVWNGLAKACVEHLRKGALITVHGYLDQYESEERQWNFITGREVEFGQRATSQHNSVSEETGDK